jgi:soluble lytic murein transglycosylase
MPRHPLLRILFVVGLFVMPLAALLFFFGWQWREHRLELRYDEEIQAASARYKIDPTLVKAVIWQESKFNAKAVGTSGEIGLMQIREVAAMEWADAEKMWNFDHKQLFDPASNIHAGAWYLSKLLKRYPQTDNPIPYALADYNAGRTHVLRWNKGAAATNSAVFLEQMDYPGTRKYAVNVMAKQKRYARQLPAPQQ